MQVSDIDLQSYDYNKINIFGNNDVLITSFNDYMELEQSGLMPITTYKVELKDKDLCIYLSNLKG
jgi:hypothetical protein